MVAARMPVCTACIRAAALFIVLLLAVAPCFAQDKRVADTAAEQEWDSVDRFSLDAVREFLARHPEIAIRDQIAHRVVLMEKMEAIARSKRAPVTVPFSTLAPWLPAFVERHQRDAEKTVCLYTVWRSEGLMGISYGTMLGEPRCALRSREDGSLWPSMRRGTIVAIRTNEMEYRWPEEGATFVADYRSTLIFGVLPEMGGLVFLEGKGRYTAVDGTQIELSEE
jgi:hypothetical protein